jgi:D-alanine-D-alanine ligase
MKNQPKNLKVAIAYNDPDFDQRHAVLGLKSETSILEAVYDVASALRKKDVTIEYIPLQNSIPDFLQKLQSANANVVFNLCESVNGDNTLEMNVPSLFELLHLPYTGSQPMTLGFCINKARVKTLLLANGIPTPAYQIFSTRPETNLKFEMNFPLIVKPNQEDASIGIEEKSVVHNKTRLREQIEFIIQTYHQPALVESYIDGREFNLGVIGNGKNLEVLPAAEIDFKVPGSVPKILSYDAKWLESSARYKQTLPICPAKISPDLAGKLARLAKQCFQILNCRDYARVDFRVGAEDRIFVLEVNPNPDISLSAGLARSVKISGKSYEDFIQLIINWALERKRD